MRRVREITETLVLKGNKKSRMVAGALLSEFVQAQMRAGDLSGYARPSRRAVHEPATDVVRRAAAVGMLAPEEAEQLVRELEP